MTNKTDQAVVTLCEDGVISIYKIGEGGDHSIKMWGYEIKGKGALKVAGDMRPMHTLPSTGF